MGGTRKVVLAFEDLTRIALADNVRQGVREVLQLLAGSWLEGGELLRRAYVICSQDIRQAHCRLFLILN